MSTPLISVIICTHNRSAELRRCLESLARQTLGREAIEVVVVNNGSTDDTSAAAREAAGQFGLALSLIELSEPGRGRASNVGMQAASAELAAFLDDDALASPGWAENLIQAFRDDPQAAAVGGPVRLGFDAEAPRWLTPEHRHLLAELDLGTERRTLVKDEERLVWANMAARIPALENRSPFREELDRVGKNLLSGGEDEFQERLRQRGLQVVYAPGAEVVHCVPAARCTEAFFRSRFYWQGATEARASRVRGDGWARRAWNVFEKTALLVKTCGAIAYYSVRGRGDRARLFRHFLRFPMGYIRETIWPLG